MYILSNIDDATSYVKTIVESVRCLNCDTTSGERKRYACGHVTCVDCAADVYDCVLCTPPPYSSSPRRDQPLTDRVNHTNDLLKAFQEAFHIDVFRHQRLSERLKIEKEVFPECIQANQTYTNKVQKTPKKGKENKNPYLPGEIVNQSVMDKSKRYVKDWLEKHENDLLNFSPRKPFSDLSVNNAKINSTKGIKYLENKSKIYKTRTHFKTALAANVSQTRLDNFLNIPSKKNKVQWKRGKPQSKIDSTRSKQESGIEIADTVVIEDSQDESLPLDKDHEAWLAVLAAENTQHDQPPNIIKHQKNKTYESSLNVYNWLSPDTVTSKDSNEVKKVPFVKRSAILEPCNYCNKFYNNAQNGKPFKESKTVDVSKNVSIVVENSSLKTTISILHDNKNTAIAMISKSTQTDITDLHTELVKTPQEMSENIFTESLLAKQIDQSTPIGKEKEIIVSDSSDSEHELSGAITVEAEVHHSTENNVCKVLSEIEINKHRRVLKRSRTPHSSDSSDKENRDPNKRKKVDAQKKNKKNYLYRL